MKIPLYDQKSNEAQKQFLWGRYLEVNTRYSEVVGQIESKVASKVSHEKNIGQAQIWSSATISEEIVFLHISITFQKGISRRMKDKESERDAAEMDLSKYNLPRIDEKERHLVLSWSNYL